MKESEITAHAISLAELLAALVPARMNGEPPNKKQLKAINKLMELIVKNSKKDLGILLDFLLIYGIEFNNIIEVRNTTEIELYNN
jgi:hypothetical protein